jgi:DNA-binding NarL/FixJ family response regulator
MMSEKSTIEIFSVEDNKVLRFALRSFLKTIADFHLCGEAENGADAIKQVAELKPEIVLVDIGLPDLDGIEVTRQIKKQNPRIRVLMLTASDHSNDIFDSLEAGADGYVLKGDSSINLEMAIRSVKIGAVWLDPAIARLVLANTRKAVVMPAGSTVSEDLKESEGHDNFTDADIERLDQVAASNCRDGVCLVDPDFMARLREVNKQSDSTDVDVTSNVIA